MIGRGIEVGEPVLRAEGIGRLRPRKTRRVGDGIHGGVGRILDPHTGTAVRQFADERAEHAADGIHGLNPGGVFGDHLEAAGDNAGSGGERIIDRAGQGPATQIHGGGADILDFDELVNVLAQIENRIVRGRAVERGLLNRMVVDFTDHHLSHGRRGHGNPQGAGGGKTGADRRRNGEFHGLSRRVAATGNGDRTDDSVGSGVPPSGRLLRYSKTFVSPKGRAGPPGRP